eukprot:6270286-Pyramimonas_sp.AAC.1
MADACATRGAGESRVPENSHTKVLATEHKAFLVRMKILQITIEALAAEQGHQKSLGAKAARRARPRPPTRL